MKKALVIFQELIKIGLFFIIFYIWLSYSLPSKTIAIIISSAGSLALESITFLFNSKRKNIKTIKSSQQTAAEQMFLSFATSRNFIDFFLQLFQTRHKDVKKKKDYIIIESQDKKRTLFVPFMKIRPFELDDLFSITKEAEKIDQIIIACNCYSSNIKEYKEKLGYEINIFDKYETYTHIYKEYDFFPQVSAPAQNASKMGIKQFLYGIFDKAKAKTYIFAGFILFLSSLYVPFSLYYKIFASLLFLFSIICLCLNHTTKTKELV